MSPKARRGAGAVFVVTILAGIGAFVAVRWNQAQEADPPREETPIERFRPGYDLGLERAGFSGLPMLQVFLDENLSRGDLERCVASPELRELLPSFTGVLINRAEELAAATRLRRPEFQLIVRALSGKFLGALAPGFDCEELRALLEDILREMIIKPEKSPIYVRLLRSADALDTLIENGEHDRAEKVVEFLREFEGEGSPAVTAAEGRLAR